MNGSIEEVTSPCCVIAFPVLAIRRNTVLVPMIHPENINLHIAEICGGENDGAEIACIAMEVNGEVLRDQFETALPNGDCLLCIPLDYQTVEKLQICFAELQARWAQ